MRRMIGYSVFLVVPMLVLGACGGSTKKVDPAADLALAKAAVLTAADLPGYTEKPYQKSNDLPDSVKKDFAKCLHVDVTILDDTPGAQKVHSSDFDKGGASVSSSVEIDPKKSDIDKGWNALTKAGIEGCLQQLFKAALTLTAPPGVSFGETTVNRIDVGIGTRSVGYSVKIPASTQGINLVIYADLLAVSRGRAGIEVTAFNRNQPFDRASEIALARTMYDRIGTKAN